jgi:hypothetical protein
MTPADCRTCPHYGDCAIMQRLAAAPQSAVWQEIQSLCRNLQTVILQENLDVEVVVRAVP